MSNATQYFETLNNAVMNGLETKLPKGYELNLSTAPEITWEPMSYETTQSRNYDLLRDGLPCNRRLHVSIYRMPSGRYETTAYFA